jgi:hypothetical protein
MASAAMLARPALRRIKSRRLADVAAERRYVFYIMASARDEYSWKRLDLRARSGSQRFAHRACVSISPCWQGDEYERPLVDLEERGLLERQLDNIPSLSKQLRIIMAASRMDESTTQLRRALAAEGVHQCAPILGFGTFRDTSELLAVHRPARLEGLHYAAAESPGEGRQARYPAHQCGRLRRRRPGRLRHWGY